MTDDRATHQPPKFTRGDLVRKRSGSQWRGRVVGEYSTELTTEGYAVESDAHPGSVQIYPAAALELVRRADAIRGPVERPQARQAMVLERWGFEPSPGLLFKLMADGYWTPWHVAQAEVSRLQAAIAAFRDHAAWPPA